MAIETLRSSMRAATRDLHNALDARVGDFESLSSYSHYVSATHAFRNTIEVEIAKFPDIGWGIPSLMPALNSDAADLDLHITDPLRRLHLGSREAVAAALYILEGSSLGAKVLCGRAAKIGFSEKFGASHLARQVKEPGRWPRFLVWLEAAKLRDQEACRAAREVFAFALDVYSGDRVSL